MASQINVEVVYASKESQFCRRLTLSAHANVAMAIKASGLLEAVEDLQLENLTVGVFAKKCQLDTSLQDKDRVEVYRPLEIDPMTARRNRAKRSSER